MTSLWAVAPGGGWKEFTVGGGGGGLTLLFDSTLGADAATIDTGAGGIAGGYSHLQFEVYARCAGAVFLDGLNANFNNDSGANYDYVAMRNSSGAINATSGYAQTAAALNSIPGAAGTANYFASVFGAVASYGVVTAGYKTGVAMGGFTYDAITHATQITVQYTWRSTAAITRMAISVGAGSNLVAGSRLTIYGSP